MIPSDMLNYSKPVSLALALLLLVTTNVSAQADRQPAGTVTAILPVGKVARLRTQAASIAELRKGDPVQWNDLLSTDTGGRMRVVLNDQSILSLGTKSRLRIIRHDSARQQTQLELSYGRVRAQVAAITRSGGLFEIRTPTAVAAVLGTEFTVEADENGETTIACLKGRVSVRNAQARVKGEQIVAAGQESKIERGKKPSAPRAAPPERLENAKRETEIAEKEPEPVKKAGSSSEKAEAKAGEAKAAPAEEKEKETTGKSAETTGKSAAEHSQAAPSTEAKGSTEAKPSTRTKTHRPSRPPGRKH